jgi:hypothetical protein
VNWDNIFNNGFEGCVEEWGVRSFPTTYLLDAEGRIRYKNLRGKSVETKVEQLLAEMN